MATARRRASKALLLGAFLAVSLLLSGCVTLTDYEAGQDYRADILAEVQAGQPVGQTFISRRARLNSIQLWLQPISTQEPYSRLTIKLYPAGDAIEQQALVQRTVSYQALASQFPLTISFPALDNPAGQGFYLLLTTDGGAVRVLGRAEEAYPDGELFVAHTPSAGDISFRLTYDYDAGALLEDLRLALSNAWLVIPALLGLWLPGRILLLALERRGKVLPFDWGERSALAVGLSLAVLPVLLLWTTVLGLHWNRMGIWIVMLTLLGIYSWSMAVRWRRKGSADQRTRSSGWKKSLATNLALTAIILSSLGVRLVMVRDLATPAWVDSVHHAIITRLILDQGAIPQTYQPLQESESATYHAGYHVSLAVFTWLSGLPLHTSMLLYGQMLNALAALSVYLFTCTIFKNRLAGLLAALITGMVSPMPAYYVSWGRYTQLAGMLILPACATLLVHLRQEQLGAGWQEMLKDIFGRRKTVFILAGIALGGLYLTHYRVAAFLVLLVGCSLLVENLHSVTNQLKQRLRQALSAHKQLADSPGEAPKPAWIAIVGTLFAGLLGLALTAPWWPAALQEMILPRLGATGGSPALYSDFSWHYLTAASGREILWLAGAGLALTVLLNWPAALKMATWVGMLFLIANLGSYKLPGGRFINNTSVEIALFMPLSAIGGYALARVMAAPQRWLKGIKIILYALPWIVACIWLSSIAARRLLPLINPVTILSRQDDLPAITWIEQNIEVEETILINPFNWGYGYYAGNDGGYWITPLAGNPTLPPSVLISFSGRPDLAKQARINSRKILEVASKPAELYALMKDLEIKYIYIGVRGGPLSATALVESKLFEAVYSDRSTWVFERR